LGSRKLTWKALLTTTTTYTYTLGVWLVLGVLGLGNRAGGIRNPESCRHYSLDSLFNIATLRMSGIPRSQPPPTNDKLGNHLGLRREDPHFGEPDFNRSRPAWEKAHRGDSGEDVAKQRAKAPGLHRRRDVRKPALRGGGLGALGSDADDAHSSEHAGLRLR
jgi:hypothetical protein